MVTPELAALDPMPIVVAVIVSFAIGMIWYAPPVFGSIWMKGAGITKKQMEAAKGRMAPAMLVNLIATAIMVVVVAAFMQMLGITETAEAAKLALMIWVGFNVTWGLAPVLWEHKPLSYYFVNVFYGLAVLMAVSVLLVTV